MRKIIKTRYEVASCADPHGTESTRKREAIRQCRRDNRSLRDNAGNTLPRPCEWTDEQDERHGDLVYDVIAVATDADGRRNYGHVDDDGRIDWTGWD